MRAFYGLAALCAFASPAAAMTTITTSAAATVTAAGDDAFTFTMGGWTGGGVLSGTFAGTDDGEGQISWFPSEGGTLTAFSASFSGNARVPDFTLSFDDTLGFVYTLGNPAWGTDTSGFIEGYAAFTRRVVLVFGPGPLATCGEGEVCGVISSAVPEPDAWALMIVGFGAVGWSMRRRRALAA